MAVVSLRSMGYARPDHSPGSAKSSARADWRQIERAVLFGRGSLILVSRSCWRVGYLAHHVDVGHGRRPYVPWRRWSYRGARARHGDGLCAAWATPTRGRTRRSSRRSSHGRGVQGRFKGQFASRASWLRMSRAVLLWHPARDRCQSRRPRRQPSRERTAPTLRRSSHRPRSASALPAVCQRSSHRGLAHKNRRS